jgi:hypothetical protein
MPISALNLPGGLIRTTAEHADRLENEAGRISFIANLTDEVQKEAGKIRAEANPDKPNRLRRASPETV